MTKSSMCHFRTRWDFINPLAMECHTTNGISMLTSIHLYCGRRRFANSWLDSNCWEMRNATSPQKSRHSGCAKSWRSHTYEIGLTKSRSKNMQRFRNNPFLAFFLTISLLAVATPVYAQTQRWSEAKAESWYQQQPWLVGSNYIPSTAINQLEMWQQATFDPDQIDKELGWAERIGMNTMRVFLHDLLWQQDPEAFRHP